MTEPNGETLTYSYSSAPTMSWMTFHTGNRSFIGTPINAEAGTYNVNVQVKDIWGDTTLLNTGFTLTVNTNQPPAQTASLVDQTLLAYRNLSYTYPVSHSDPEGEPI